MTKRIYRDYADADTANVDRFVDSLKENATKGGMFDSATANDFIATAQSQKQGFEIPTPLQSVLDEAGKDGKTSITRAILDGVSAYEESHGVNAPADLVRHAMHMAYATTDDARKRFGLMFDSANSLQSDPMGLQANRAVIAIVSSFAEAVPFAHYLPADIQSNKAILAILNHVAGKTYGAYSQGGLMDGVSSGDNYITSSRLHVSMTDETSKKATGKLTAVQQTPDACNQTAGTVKLIRGASIVYVNGMVAGRENDVKGTGNSALSGGVELSGVSYVIGGFINTDSGVYEVTSTPELPTTVPVAVEGFVDYERADELTPSIVSNVSTFDLFARPWRVITQQTIDSRTQMSNELGIDPYGESILAIQTQFANERHYQVLSKAKRLAQNNQVDYDFEWSTRNQQMTRSQLWQDFAAPLGAVSQQMAIDTMNHGVTHLYVGKNIAAQWMALPREIFEPSGVSERAGIFRIGRLFGRFEVYYTPKVLTETATASQVLCVGRATDVTRNPFVLGDAVPPTVIPLAINADMKQGAAFYARNFTNVNPHTPSSLGCAMINITNLFA